MGAGRARRELGGPIEGRTAVLTATQQTQANGDSKATGYVTDASDATKSAAPAGRVLVTLATYNECDNIAGMVDAVHAALPEAHVLVVDDNSPDGTGKIADELAAARPWLSVLHRQQKKGLGAALLHALQVALERRYDFWITMDSDFSHPPARLPALVEGMANHDVMIGSRYIPGGGIVGWDFKRHFMSRAINFYSRWTLGLKARDTSGAYRCYRLSKLRELDLACVYSTGYAFMEEFLFHCKRIGCRIGETPIVFENRKAGASKISAMEAIKALWGLLYVGVRNLLTGK
jgi:dolichol-phosphate mannosyltransferase